jgi:hypothetical protein
MIPMREPGQDNVPLVKFVQPRFKTNLDGFLPNRICRPLQGKLVISKNGVVQGGRPCQVFIGSKNDGPPMSKLLIAAAIVGWLIP